MKKISIIIPTWNEEGNIKSLVERIHLALSDCVIRYEIIFIDDHSIDNTKHIIQSLSSVFPVYFYMKKGQRGKATSLLEGFTYAKYDLICMIDADLQYPPEVIPEMIKKINEDIDIVIAERNISNITFTRKLFSRTFFYIFGKLIHGLDFDIQSGLKIFRKEIIERLTLHPSGWAFDLEFLKKSIAAGYHIGKVNIVFDKRVSGKTKVNLFKTSFEIGFNALLLRIAKSEVIPFSKKQVKSKGKGFHYKGTPFVPYNELSFNDSAIDSVTVSQFFFVISLLSVLLIGFIINWHATLFIIILLLTALYFVDLLFNLFLIYRSFSKSPEIKVSNKELQEIPDDAWPRYSIFCPLYKEWEVVPQFINAMSNLDYPKDKIQVMLLLEADDKETIKKIKEFVLPSYFQVVVVPHAKPKTKPKACNYGLAFATGEYIVIYDAEDIPEPDQLKKAIIAFKKASKNTACLQAKLNFYNPYQNLLTRLFTAEYSLWFDLVLTGLQSINAPIPLGGTSNHFKTQELKEMGGWDSFNVTEDADLGMRLVKKGYRTAIVESTTFEEANSDYLNWFHQRSRWIKGYIQTYFVHMRYPTQLLISPKDFHLITFNLIIGGKVLSMLINPLMWAITISYFLFRPFIGGFIETFFPGPVLYFAAFSLVFGNFLYIYYYVVGCAKRKQFRLTPYAIFVPIYWLAMSAAAMKAAYEFFVKPHYWAKTKHGLFTGVASQGKNYLKQQIAHQEIAI